MPTTVTRVHYRGNKWVLLFLTIFFFPIAVLLFLLDAVWIRQEVTPEQLAALER